MHGGCGSAHIFSESWREFSSSRVFRVEKLFPCSGLKSFTLFPLQEDILWFVVKNDKNMIENLRNLFVKIPPEDRKIVETHD